MHDGNLAVLITRSLSGLFEGDQATVRIRSPGEQAALIAFLSAKLLHESAEILMESHPAVRWEQGARDPNIVNSEAVAYLAELNFLTRACAMFPADSPGFLRTLRPLIREDSNSPWLTFYATVLEQGQRVQESIHAFLTQLGYALTNFSL